MTIGELLDVINKNRWNNDTKIVIFAAGSIYPLRKVRHLEKVHGKNLVEFGCGWGDLNEGIDEKNTLMETESTNENEPKEECKETVHFCPKCNSLILPAFHGGYNCTNNSCWYFSL